MRWKTKNPLGCFTLTESVEIDEGPDSVFALWNHYEAFPRFMESVRRVKRIDPECVLWDVDLIGHQIVWEARIVEMTPDKRVRWESSWGAQNSGVVRCDAIAVGRTALTVEIEYRPKGAIQNLGARLGLADLQVRRDLERFREFVENPPPEKADRKGNDGWRRPGPAGSRVDAQSVGTR